MYIYIYIYVTQFLFQWQLLVSIKLIAVSFNDAFQVLIIASSSRIIMRLWAKQRECKGVALISLSILSQNEEWRDRGNVNTVQLTLDWYLNITCFWRYRSKVFMAQPNVPTQHFQEAPRTLRETEIRIWHFPTTNQKHYGVIQLVQASLIKFLSSNLFRRRSLSSCHPTCSGVAH